MRYSVPIAETSETSEMAENDSLSDFLASAIDAAKRAGEVVKETIDANAKIEFRPNTEDHPHKRKPDIRATLKCFLDGSPLCPFARDFLSWCKTFDKKNYIQHTNQ